MKTEKVKSDKDKQKQLLYIPLWLFLSEFAVRWHRGDNLIPAAIFAAVVTAGAVIIGIAFVKVWARTHSVILALVVVGGGAITILGGIILLWSKMHR